MNSHVLKIECTDQKGLIHKITGVLYKKGLNIISNHEFVDHGNHRFFMRSEITGSRINASAILRAVKKHLPRLARLEIVKPRKKRIVVMATHESHCLGDLLIRLQNNELNAGILAVISNHNHLKSLVQKFGVPFQCVSHQGIARQEHETRILRKLKKYRPDLIIMAKYMRVLSPVFIGKYPRRILNIHHSFLPAFLGAKPYAQAFDRGVKIIGATAHFATPALDDGPIIAQSVIPVTHAHSASDMSLAGRDIEKQVLARALKLVLEDRVFVSGNKTIVFD